MVLHFPDSDTLHLALTCGAVPANVSLAPVRAGFDPQGAFWVEPSVSVSRAAQKTLARLGAVAVKGQEKRLTDTLTCWPQLFPLQRLSAPPTPSAQTPVLFELANSDQLPAIAGEVLRLGNDRQSYRVLGGDDSHTLLRVVGPPYYTLLRALDRDDSADAPRAYLEAVPRVWIQVGYSHPLLNQLQPPPGKLVLLRPPRAWQFIDEAPFHDLYDMLEFILPRQAASLEDVPLQQRLRVPLRLVPGGANDVAELWVLRERGLEQIDQLVSGANDQLLSRLSFAVGEHDRRRSYVLRLRPSKLPPPVLEEMQAVSFRPYQGMPNLFLPCGKGLRPPLRRDAVRKLLADQADLITWLYPHDDGTFTAERLPDQVFRPLSDWIDYVLDHDRAALQAWVESTQFDFDSFLCRDDQEPTPDRPKKSGREKHGDRGMKSEKPTAQSAVQFQTPKHPQPPAELDAPTQRKRAEPSALQKELQALEQQFVECEGSVDAPERQALWPRLAELNNALDQGGEAMICWANALWDAGPDAPGLARRWGAHDPQATGGVLPQTALARLLGLREPTLPEVRHVAICAITAPDHPQPRPLYGHLAEVQAFLQRHESMLPVRVVWLAAKSLFHLSGGDVLALTRCRDRLLERLYKHGLAGDLDLPNFLRFSAERGDRMRVFRDWLLKLPERVEHWLTTVDRGLADPANTNAYAQLILAFGMARLGEEQECRRLQGLAHTKLQQEIQRLEPLALAYAKMSEEEQKKIQPPGPEAHTALLEAFDFRLEQALAGKAEGDPLPAAWFARLQPVEKTTQYKVEKLREYSRILEPHVKINPYKVFHFSSYGDLERTLNQLQDVADGRQLQDVFRRLLVQVERRTAEDKERWGMVLTAGLALAPRAGVALAEELLDEVLPCCDALADLLRSRRQQSASDEAEAFGKLVGLLEKALFLAAHFNQASRVQQFVGRFGQWLQAQQGPAALKAISAAAAQSFRGLRKLGLRDEIDQLLRQMADVVLQGREMTSLRDDKHWPEMLTMLLRVADGWYYFGKEREAGAIVEEARRLLYTGSLDKYLQYPLALAYVATLAQAPVEQALQGIEELFHKLQRAHDAFATNSHYAVLQLHLIETVVLAVVSDDFAVGAQARRWLDDEEYLIRRRIHEDVNEVVRMERG